MWRRKQKQVQQKAPILMCGESTFMAQALQRNFTRKGYEVQTVGTAFDGLELLRDRPYAAIYVDEGLPDLEGFRQAIRELPSCAETKVVVLPRQIELSNPFDPPSSFLPGPPGVLAIRTERFKESLRKLGL